MKIAEVFSEPGRPRRLAEHTWRHFREDRCFEEAASLSYTSLLSMVPLLAVVFGVVSVFPVFEQWSDRLKEFLLKNLVPAAGEQVHATVTGLLSGVGALTLPGTTFLILTALLLMLRIEKAFNRIWRVGTPRALGARIAMYWAVLTLGPLALVATAALSAGPLLESVGLGSDLPGWLRSVGTFVLTWAAFGLAFLLVPNRSVRFEHAALGALLSAVLFTLARAGFAAWVGMASFNLLYGTLATIPIFLFWLYLVWSVILLGASLAASLTTFSDRGGGRGWHWQWEFLLAYRLVGRLAAAQRSGESVAEEVLLEAEPDASDTQVQHILAQLAEADLVTRDAAGDWLLTRDLDRVTLLDLYRAGRFHLPVGETPDLDGDSPWDAAFVAALGAEDAAVNLGASLKSLYQAPPTETAPPGDPT